MKDFEAKLNNITIAKSLGILLVVSGHIGGIYQYIGIPIYSTKPEELFPAYSFHIPLFIFLSGYFFNPSYIYNLKELVSKRINTLVLPYYKWNLFYGVLVTILINTKVFSNANTITLYNLIVEPIFGAYQYNLNGPAWFMLSLFFIQIFYTLIKRVLENNSEKIDLYILIVLIVVSIVSIVISNNIELKQHVLVLFIFRTSFGILFFHLGYCFTTYIRDKIKFSWKSLIIIVAVKLFFIVIAGKNTVFSMRTMIFYSNNFSPIIASMLGIMYILNISELIDSVLSKKGLRLMRKVFNFIGTNTCSIMIHHMTINLAITLTLKSLGNSEGILGSNTLFELMIRPTLCFILAVYFDKYVSKILEFSYSLLKKYNLSYSKLV
nr:acyltransferase family protein [Clostridioides sp.]